jgi:hypothetical protein
MCCTAGPLVKMGTTAAQKKPFFNLRHLKGQMRALARRTAQTGVLECVALPTAYPKSTILEETIMNDMIYDKTDTKTFEMEGKCPFGGDRRFNRWIARWHQKPDRRPPSHHRMTHSPLGSLSTRRPGQGPGRSGGG